MRTPPQPRITQLGTFAVLFEAPGEFALGVQRRIWGMAERFTGAAGIVEAVPGVTNLLLVYADPVAELAPIRTNLLLAWHESALAATPEGRCIEVPVTYGGQHGTDLATVAEQTGLTLAEVVRRHRDVEYRVFAIGSQPGFAYLGGLDPTIARPRKAVPVLHVAAGTVVIGGVQAGVVASAGPNGWHAIGHTEVRLFDPAINPPTFFASGDRVRFRAVALLA